MRTILLKANSKKDIIKVAEIASEDPHSFAELISLMKDKSDLHLAGLAAWALSNAVDINPSSVKPHLSELVRIAGRSNHPAIKRNIVRIWSHVEIPGKYAWKMADQCYRFLCSPDEAIAVKAFSITVLQRLVKQLPELFEEIKFEIEKQLPHSGPAFRVRAREFMNQNLMKN